jgi:hypothetical protein
LLAHIARLNNTGNSEHSVSQGRFTVINMSNNAEIPDLFRICVRRLRCFG